MNLKFFFKLFFLLLFFEILAAFLDTYLSQNTVEVFGIDLKTVTNILMNLFSLPLSLISRELPFYTQNLWLSLGSVFFNLMIHTYVIYRLLSTIRKKS